MRSVCRILPFLISAVLFAQIRPLGHAPFGKKLFCIQTEYFDFIFPEESAASARVLASRADDFYREICARLEVSDSMRKALCGMPVFITRETEILNGYFTPLPYNRIVLYDSVPPQSFAVFSDTILSVFYHELVHAVSLNIKSPFWYGFSRAAGAVYSPSLLLNLPTSFTEGIAVSFESARGEGRLNDAYSMHVIRQAKLEGKFPDWRTAAGSYSAYTDGSLPYMFGAAFADYLQKTYGQHPYAEFWKQSGRMHLFKLSAGIFKKVYGISLKQAWNDFEQSIELPCAAPPAREATALCLQATQVCLQTTSVCREAIPMLCREATQVCRQTTPLFPEKSTENKDAVKGRHLYKSLTFAPDVLSDEDDISAAASGLNGGGTLAWYDAASSSVRKVRIGADGKPIGKPVFLYTSDLSERLIFSREGDFSVSSGLRGGKKAQSAASVYDVKRGIIAAEVSGLRSAALIRTKDGKDMLAGVQRERTGLCIAIYDMQSLLRNGKNGLSSAHEDPPPIHKIPFGRTSFPFDICDAGDGRLVCLVKGGKNDSPVQDSSADDETESGLSYKLFFYDLETSRSYSYEVVPNAGVSPALHSLSVYEGWAFFSCSLGPDFQPALARADFALFKEPPLEGISCSSDAFSVLSVQKEQYSGGVFSPVCISGGTAFISRFYEHRRLSVLSETVLEKSFCDAYRFSFTPSTAEAVRTKQVVVPPVSDTAIRPYRPFQYLKKGTIVPFAGFLNAAFFERYAPDFPSLGLSAFSGDPAERFLLAAGTGIDPFARNYNVNAFVAASSYPFGFAAGFYTQAGLKKSELEKAAVKLSAEFAIPVGIPFTHIYGANNTGFFYTLSKTPFAPAGFLFENKTELAVRFAKRTGTGVYETLGLKAGFFVLLYKNEDPMHDKKNLIGAHAFETSVQLPFLLPFKNPRRFTLNLPVAFDAIYYINASRLWEVRSNAVLFSYNMQVPVPFMPIFIREITLDGGVDYTAFYNNTSLLSVHSSLFFGSALNSGSATGIPFDIGVSFRWTPPDRGSDAFKFSFKFNLKL